MVSVYASVARRVGARSRKDSEDPMFANVRRRVLVVLLGAMCALTIVATPAYASGVTQVGKPTLTSFTVTWDAYKPSSTSYSFRSYEVWVGKDSKSLKLYKTISSASENKCTVSGLPAGAKRYVQVKLNEVYTNSYDGSTRSYNWSVGSLYDAKTLPGQVKYLKQKKWWYFINKFDATWKAIGSADGYLWVCYTYNGKKFASGTATAGTNPTAEVNKVKNNQIYKMKVRAYTEINGKKYWGSWSTIAYFFTQPRVTKLGTANGKLTIGWGKVAGATGYTVMVSTKPKSGYKKVKTVSNKVSSVSIAKLGNQKIKKGGKYYVYVITNKKVGSKTYTSGRLYYWNTKEGPGSFGYFD